MIIMDVKQEINILNSAIECLDLNDDDKAVFDKLLNLIERLCQENVQLRQENQNLKDEIQRLKGEKGKPNIKGNVKGNSDSNQDKRNSNATDADCPIGKTPPKVWSKASKQDQIEIDKEERIRYEGDLPTDAVSKGVRPVVVQGLKIERYNVRYLLEQFYSPSQGKTYSAALPAEVDGEFSAELKAHVIYLYHECRIPENKIHKLLTDRGVKISSGQISNILIKKHEPIHNEKDEIVQAAIAATDIQHIDDTGARVMGVNQYFVVLCNDYFSAFFTRPKKTRLTVLSILSQNEFLGYTINGVTLDWLEGKRTPRHILDTLRSAHWLNAMTETEFIAQIKAICPQIKPRYLEWVLEAAAITWYQEKHSSERIKILVSDAARQYVGITERNALCWVHEERHYKKLLPVFNKHKALVKAFRKRIWDYYRKLEAYKVNPTPKAKVELEKEFDEIFSTQTGYDALDDCIVNTNARKDGLLVVLDYPDVPLHNNPAELAVREYVIKRKISHGTRSEEGTRSWESFLTIKDTCRKLGVNFYDYIYDRISKRFQMPSLASLILSRASP
jgi:hypothetical protein